MWSRTPARLAWACLLAPLAGCNLFMSPQFESRQAVTVPHVAGKPVDVETENGSVTVVKADRDDVEIEATVRANSEERARAVKVVAQRGDDGTLTVRAEWPDGVRQGSEGCSFKVAIPDADGVTLRTSNGGLTLTGLRGPAELKTSNGRIEVAGHDGPIDAGSSNGGIDIDGATGRVAAKTSNGEITVALAAGAKGPVDLDTSNGGVELDLPSGFPGELSLSTSNGSVEVDGFSGAEVRRDGRDEAVIVFGDGPKSRADTSNGTVRVRERPAAAE